MTIDKVKDDVLQRTKTEANKIIKKAKDEASQIKSHRKSEIEKFKKNLAEKKERIIGDYDNLKKASVDFSVRRYGFEIDSEIMNKIKDESSNKIKNLSKDKREEHVKKLFDIASKKIDVARIYCNEEDKGYLSDIETKSANILGGLIAENKEGDIRLDYSYDLFMKNVFADNASEIRNALNG